MNKTQFLLVLAFITISFNAAFAQYGYRNGYGYGNGYGNNYGMGMSQVEQNAMKPKEIPVEVTVAKIMEKLKPELQLDELQTIAIGNVYSDIVKSQLAIIKDEKLRQEEKSEEIKTLAEISDRKVNEYLSEEQKQKFKAFKEKKGDNKKEKKKKKED